MSRQWSQLCLETVFFTLKYSCWFESDNPLHSGNKKREVYHVRSLEDNAITKILSFEEAGNDLIP
jgi:hypothetical protein